LILLTVRNLCFTVYGVGTCILVLGICAYMALSKNRRNKNIKDIPRITRTYTECNWII